MRRALFLVLALSLSSCDGLALSTDRGGLSPEVTFSIDLYSGRVPWSFVVDDTALLEELVDRVEGLSEASPPADFGSWETERWRIQVSNVDDLAPDMQVGQGHIQVILSTGEILGYSDDGDLQAWIQERAMEAGLFTEEAHRYEPGLE